MLVIPPLPFARHKQGSSVWRGPCRFVLHDRYLKLAGPCYSIALETGLGKTSPTSTLTTHPICRIQNSVSAGRSPNGAWLIILGRPNGSLGRRLTGRPHSVRELSPRPSTSPCGMSSKVLSTTGFARTRTCVGGFEKRALSRWAHGTRVAWSPFASPMWPIMQVMEQKLRCLCGLTTLIRPGLLGQTDA